MSFNFLFVVVVFLAVLGAQFSAVPSDEYTAYEVEVMCYGNTLSKYPTNGLGVVFPEPGDCIVVGGQVLEQPDDLDVSSALFFKSAGGTHLVHIAIDEKLKQVSRMIGWPALCGNGFKTHL